MRVTTKVKTETRRRILDTALERFKTDGWHGTTTRAIAVAAGVATGTLFNYFASKEALAATLIGDRLGVGKRDERKGPVEETPEADLFEFIWTGFSNLRDLRAFLAPAAETIFSPLARSSVESPGDAIRIDHLEQVEAILAGHGFQGPRPLVAQQLYWTLYLGVFAFWAADESPGQEDTLALLDQSLKLYVASLNEPLRKETS